MGSRIELPALLPDGEPVWPEFWNKEELLKTKASIPVSNWNSQYMQQPTAEEGAILKRDWWCDWVNKVSTAIRLHRSILRYRIYKIN